MLSGMSVKRFVAAGGGAAVLTISGQNVSTISAVSSVASTSGIRINTDGTIDRLNGTGYTQIDSSTDWLVPPDDAPGTYQFRVTGITFNSGSVWLSEAAAEDTWIAVSGGALEWSVRDLSITAGGIIDVDFTIEGRLGGSGGALDTGAFNLYSEYENI